MAELVMYFPGNLLNITWYHTWL